jgi:hypothetical protein
MRVSLLLTVALAVSLGFIVYLSVTSLPYLAVSPSTDPAFGALNACMLDALHERTGFAVSRDAQRLAAWSSDGVVICSEPHRAPTRVWKHPGITVGSFDGQGQLWLAALAEDASSSTLWLLTDASEPKAMASLAVQALAGMKDGVVVLEANGRLTALTPEGDMLGARDLPSGDLRAAVLQASADGQRVAVVVGGGVFAFSSKLELLRAEAPCTTKTLWWLPEGHRARLECASTSPLALTFDVDTGVTEAAEPRSRVPSTLVGPAAVWVQPCDVLPCSAEPP